MCIVCDDHKDWTYEDIQKNNVDVANLCFTCEINYRFQLEMRPSTK